MGFSKPRTLHEHCTPADHVNAPPQPTAGNPRVGGSLPHQHHGPSRTIRGIAEQSPARHLGPEAGKHSLAMLLATSSHLKDGTARSSWQCGPGM